MNFLAELRRSRRSPATAYTEFLSQQSPTSLHIFVEGDNDSSFYRNFFIPYREKFNTLKFYDCGGKHQVYETRHKIMARKDPPVWSNTMVLLYFVDKDLSDLLQEDHPIGTDIFVTDYYSVENYLVSEEMLEIIWTDLFNFYGNSEPEFPPVREKFQEELQRFYDYIRPVMIWIIHHKKNRVRFRFHDIKLHELFEVNESLELRCIEGDVQSLIAKLDRSCNLMTTTQCLEEEKDILELNPKTYIRGKFEVWFFLQFLKALEKSIKDMGIEIRVQQGLLKEKVIVQSLGPRLNSIPKSLSKFLERNLNDIRTA